jgi:acyl-CoA dehydrogenase
VQVFGGQGYVKGRGIERFHRDVRPARIYEGTSQTHLLNIAQAPVALMVAAIRS